MRIVFFRHGVAEPGHERLPDAERALTPQGVDRTMQAARGLAKFIPRPDVILTSPKTRAMQTAAILGDAFELVPVKADAIAGESVDAIVRLLRSRREDDVMIVGHEPTLSGTIEKLCGGVVELKKAGAALVEVPSRREEPPTRATLHWLLPPKTLRLMAD